MFAKLPAPKRPWWVSRVPSSTYTPCAHGWLWKPCHSAVFVSTTVSSTGFMGADTGTPNCCEPGADAGLRPPTDSSDGRAPHQELIVAPGGTRSGTAIRRPHRARATRTGRVGETCV